MLQFASPLIPVLVAGILAYLTYYLSRILEKGGAQALLGFRWLLEVTPALNTFLIFVSRGAYLTALILCAFGRTSKHMVISLDILYLVSLLLLILYHTLKQPEFSFS